jgi:hypothetical protein
MVSNTRDGVDRAAANRSARMERVGIVALVLAVLASIVGAVEFTREFAWLLALPAVLLAMLAASAEEGRKFYAACALLLGWFAFAFSFALMIWG